LNPEDGTDRLSENVGEKFSLPITQKSVVLNKKFVDGCNGKLRLGMTTWIYKRYMPLTVMVAVRLVSVRSIFRNILGLFCGRCAIGSYYIYVLCVSVRLWCGMVWCVCGVVFGVVHPQ